MASHSLYRKWRSQTFSDLIGQEPVVRTLLNAVRDGRLAHAYLFCGPRGTGKTSAARLLAKAVNCANPHDGEPCNECLSCREITAGTSPDVIEIDAASNTGVDNIRDLRETVNLLGTGGKYRLYVVDECFSYGELVTLAGGAKMPIGKLVDLQWQGEVLSYNEQTGKIEPKLIVRHMKKRGTVPTVRVTFDNNRSIVCTINHKFYTPQGQVCAGHLEVGQFVYTNRERITQHQRAVVMSAAIGDGHISLTGSAMRARLSITHGVAQKEYLDYKVALLGDLVRTPPHFQDGAGTYSKVGTYRATTLSRPEIAQIRRELYGADGKKRLSRAYLEQLDELALALWYLDDGSLTTQKHWYQRAKDGSRAYSPTTRSYFSMYGFSELETRLVSEWLKERWAIDGGVTVTAKGPVIWLTLAGTARLHTIIAAHVPPIMEYKLLPEYRGRFQPLADSGHVGGLAVSIVKSTEQVPAPEFVYNIEVADNHNYFVRDMLVANCHMLTVSAFNALLKTLEEPPPHVIFVLATTEAHKVLPTIVSRCQRFDFRRHTIRNIIARLQHVAEGEGLELEPAAAELLARAAQGGMRDALSLLDQAMAFCGAQVDAETVRRMLGIADPGLLRTLIACVAEQRAADGLHLINELVGNGADLRQLNSQLAEEWRALVLARAGADVAAMMDRTDDDARELAELASHFTLETLTACARVFARNETPARGLPVPQLALELSFLECVAIQANGGSAAVTSAAQPAERLPDVTRRAAGPAPANMPATPSAPTMPAPPSHPSAPAATHASAPQSESLPPTTTPSPRPSVGASHGSPAASADEDASIAVPSMLPAVNPSVPPSPDSVAAGPASPPEPADEDAADHHDTLLMAQDRWALIRQVCKQKSPSVAALLHNARPVLVEPGATPVLVIQADHPFHLEKLRSPASREAVEWALEQVLETRVRIRIVPGRGNDGEGANGTNGAGGGGGRGGGGNGGNGGARPRAGGPGASSPARSAGSSAANGARPADPDAGGGPAAHNGANGANGALRDASAGYAPPPANVTPIRASVSPGANGANGHAAARALDEQVRADAVIQALMRTYGAELADVRSLDDEDDRDGDA